MTTRAEAIAEYKQTRNKHRLFVILLTVGALITIPVTLGFGVYNISIIDSITVFFQHLTGNIVDVKADRYIWDVRLPRALGAVVLGAGLSVAGAVMQNNFKNPLAEPYTMGISSGAFMGVVVAMVTGITIIPGLTGQAGFTVNAFCFALIPIAMILLISRFRKVSPVSMILIGIAIMFLFNSLSQIMLLASSAETLQDAYTWRVGNTSRIYWAELPIMTTATVIVVAIIWILSDKLNVMYAGDRGAQSMGIKPQLLRLSTLTLVSLMTAAIVSVTGTIGFIGLVGPHIARVFVGSNNRYLIPASAAFGAIFMALADTVAKVTGPDGLPVGIICSMVGGPLFIYILIKRSKKVWI